ncbi:TspO/MBR family protein [Staphylococcus hyicus]
MEERKMTMSKYRNLKQFMRGISPLLGGQMIGGIIARNARVDYAETKTPPFSPPGFVFPIVWSVLYTSMGIAHALVSRKHRSYVTSFLYYTQLVLNYAWAVIYFRLKWRGVAVIESFLLLGAVMVTTVQFFRKSQIAGVLFLPYVAWCAFASYITTGSYSLNKNQSTY